MIEHKLEWAPLCRRCVVSCTWRAGLVVWIAALRRMSAVGVHVELCDCAWGSLRPCVLGMQRAMFAVSVHFFVYDMPRCTCAEKNMRIWGHRVGPILWGRRPLLPRKEFCGSRGRGAERVCGSWGDRASERSRLRAERLEGDRMSHGVGLR